MKKIYYDTAAFWQFFINCYINNQSIDKDIEQYYPLSLNRNIIRCTSPWTLDEFFHNYIKIKKAEIKIKFPFFDHEEILKRTEALTKTKEFLSLFKQEIVNTREINDIFISLFLHARDSNILSLKKHDKKIHSKDLLHLSYALVSECDTLITCDNGFALLTEKREIKDIINTFKIRTIVILDVKLEKVVQKLDFFP